MSLRNEVFEGLAAAQAAKRLVYDPRDWYAEEMYKAARRQNKRNEEVDKNREETIAKGPPVDLTAPTSTAGTVSTLANPTAAGQATAVSTEGHPFRYNALGMPLPAADPFSGSILKPVYRRGGRVQRFADGGIAVDPDIDLRRRPPVVDPDQIVAEMTERAVAADPNSIRRGSLAGGYDPRVPKEPAAAPPAAVDTKSWGQRKAEELGPRFRESMAVPQTDAATKAVGEGGFGTAEILPRDDLFPRVPKGSKLDRAVQGTVSVATAPNRAVGQVVSDALKIIAPGPDALEDYQRNQERIRLQGAGPGLLDTPEEQRRKEKEQREGLAKNKALDTKTPPSEVTPLEQRPTYGTEPAVVPTLSDVIQQGGVPEQYGPHRPKEQPKPGANGPNVPGKNTPGGSPGASTTTPPPGAAPANRPTDVSKPAPGNGAAVPATPAPATAVPTAPGPGGARVPRGSLTDQTRIAAYDPRADAADPANRKYVDFGGNDIRQVIGGAMQYAQANGPPTVLGEGATSRQALNGYINAHNPQAKFSPGEAMLAGMVSDYRTLLSQGRIEEANRMAYGLIQAATLEAASFGKSAMEMMKQGNFQTAAQQFIRGVNYFPDGMTHRLGPDGRTVITTNNKGEVTARTQITPQILLQAVTGLADGTMFWNSLQGAAAAATTGKDKNANLRKLNEDLRREQIEGAKLRNANLRNPKPRVGRQPAQLSDTARDIYGLTGHVPKEEKSGDVGEGPPQHDYSHIDTEIADIPDDQDR